VFDAMLDGSGATAEDRALPNTGDIGRDLRAVLRETVEELVEPDTDRLVLHRCLLRTAPLDDRFANDVVDPLLAGLAPRS
jgi:hypothetical protein